MRALLAVLCLLPSAVFASESAAPLRLDAVEAPVGGPEAPAAAPLAPAAEAEGLPVLPQAAVEAAPAAAAATPVLASPAPASEGRAALEGARAQLSTARRAVAKSAEAGAAASNLALEGAFDGMSAGLGGLAPIYHLVHSAPALGSELRRHHPPDEEPILPVPPQFAQDVPSARDEAPFNWTGRISLHLHSVYSDGTLTPTQLMDLAYQQGVRVISLTDHDTTAGLDEARKRASELGMTFIAGEELTARGGVHVGALGIDPTNPALIAHNELVRVNRLARAQAIINHLNEQFRDHPSKPAEQGLVLTIDEVKAHSRYDEGGTIEIPAIARVLLDHGLIAHVDDAYQTYLTPKIMSDSSVQPDPTVGEVLDVIHRAGGKAFLNHPYTVRAPTENQKQAKIQAMLPGFDGIEAYRDSAATSEEGRKRFDGRVAQYLGYAGQFHLLVGNGADYHGPDTHLNKLVVYMPKHYAGDLLDGIGLSQAKSALDAPEPAQGAGSAAPGAAALLASGPLLKLMPLMHNPGAWALALIAAALGAGAVADSVLVPLGLAAVAGALLAPVLPWWTIPLALLGGYASVMMIISAEKLGWLLGPLGYALMGMGLGEIVGKILSLLLRL